MGLLRPSAAPPRLAGTLTGIVLCVDALWLLVAGWIVAWPGLIMAALGAVLLPLTIGRYRNDLRVASTLRAAALLLTFSAAASALSYLVVSTNAPLVDAVLAQWDGALGFDWMALRAWLHDHAVIQTALRFAYVSGLPQIVLVVMFLGFSARSARLEEFLILFFLATLVCVILSGPFPAAGAWKYHAGLELPTLSHFEMLRAGRMREIPLDQWQGLVSIPSLHAAMAVLLVYAVRGTALLPALSGLNAAMIAATPVDGSHYLVDVLAGVALALVLITVSRRLRA
jgi:PAP2 superfamily protein